MADSPAQPRPGRPVAFTAALLLNDHEEILLLQRSPRARLAAHKWGFPGGHLHAGEDPQAGILRELDEELGKSFIVRLEARLGPVQTLGLSRRHAIHLFRYRWQGGFIALNAEHTRFAWVSRAAYPSFAVMPGITEDLGLFRIWSGGAGEGPDR